MRKWIHWGFYQMAFLKKWDTFIPGIQWNIPKQSIGFLSNITQWSCWVLTQKWTKSAKSEFSRLTGPSHDCIHLQHKCFLFFSQSLKHFLSLNSMLCKYHWIILNPAEAVWTGMSVILPSSQPLGSPTCPFIPSDIISSLGWGGGCVWSLRMTMYEFFPQ